MGVETELKLSLPLSAAPRLRKHPLLAGQRPQRQHLANTYYDTPALDLKKRRIALRHRHTAWGQLLTVKSAEPAVGGLACRSEWEAPSLPGVFDFSHVDDKPLRKWLEGLVPVLQPAFTTDFVRTTWLLEPAPGTRVELAFDHGKVSCGEAQEALCEIELELLEGPASALFELALALQADLPLRPEVVSKAERGYRVFQQARPQPARARKAGIDKGMAPLAAFKVIALECVEQLQRNEAGARAGLDPEFVHQARVAIRRLRSALRLWRPLLPAVFREHFAPAWRDLAATLGEARNLDVFATETLPPLLATFPERPPLTRLQHLAERRRQHAQADVRRAFDAPRFARLLLGFTAALHALPESGSAAEGDAVQGGASEKAAEPQTLSAFARRRLRRFDRDVQRLSSAIGSDQEAHHQLRIAFKRLRYALEFMAPLYGTHAIRRYLAAAAEMQALLGAMNDLTVAERLVAELRRRRTDDIVHGWLAGQAVLLHNLLPAALSGFVEARKPWRGRRG